MVTGASCMGDYALRVNSSIVLMRVSYAWEPNLPMETLVLAPRELRGVVPGIVIEGKVAPTLIHRLFRDPSGRRKAHSFEGPIAFEEWTPVTRRLQHFHYASQDVCGHRKRGTYAAPTPEASPDPTAWISMSWPRYAQVHQ